MHSSPSIRDCALPAATHGGGRSRVALNVPACPPGDAESGLIDLIGEIYDAAIDPDRWCGTLDRLAQFVGGAAAALYAKDSTGESGEFYHDNGCTDPTSRRLYREEYARLDPTTRGHVSAAIGEPMATDDLVSYAEFAETRFFQEWAQPNGLAHGVSAMLDRTASGAAVFGVFWTSRNAAVDPDARSRMRAVSPHVRRAALVGRTIDVVEARSASLSETFDRIGTGVLLVEADGRLIEANRAGREMADRGDALRIANGTLVIADPRAGAQLRTSLAAAQDGDGAAGSKCVAIPLKGRAGGLYVAHVLPLSGGRRRQIGGKRSASAIFLREAAVPQPHDPSIIASTYKLTPTELRVLLAIVEVGGVPEVAESLGVAETTVKTHLGRLFGKTGAARQADLVKLVAGFSSPVLNS